MGEKKGGGERRQRQSGTGAGGGDIKPAHTHAPDFGPVGMLGGCPQGSAAADAAAFFAASTAKKSLPAAGVTGGAAAKGLELSTAADELWVGRAVARVWE